MAGCRALAQLGHADGGAGVAAARAEHLVEIFAGGIDHRRLLDETRRAGDVAGHLEQPLDPLQAAQRLLQRLQAARRAEPGGLAGLFQVEFAADLAGPAQLAVLARQLAADVGDAGVEHHRLVGAAGDDGRSGGCLHGPVLVADPPGHDARAGRWLEKRDLTTVGRFSRSVLRESTSCLPNRQNKPNFSLATGTAARSRLKTPDR